MILHFLFCARPVQFPDKYIGVLRNTHYAGVGVYECIEKLTTFFIFFLNNRLYARPKHQIWCLFPFPYLHKYPSNLVKNWI